mgnify:CR=1 FL=1
MIYWNWKPLISVGLFKFGQPAIPLIKKYNVVVFSSNYNLYGDLSWRVMETLRMMLGKKNVEVYSVDEAFLDLSNMPPSQRNAFCESLQKRILKETGIPISIGLGQTKTLAKAANYIAKKILKSPVFNGLCVDDVAPEIAVPFNNH